MGTPRVTYDVDLIARDMARKGWNNSALATKARVSPMSVGRFLSGQTQTAKMAGKIARALGHGVDRYLAPVGAAAVAS